MKDSFVLNVETVKLRLKQYRYPLLVLLLGICILLLPSGKKPTEQQEVTAALPEKDLEARLETLLSQVEGAGKVRVLLAVETGPTVRYQEDVKAESHEDSMQRQTQTVLVSSGGEEAPVPVCTTYPVYKGAVILCQGADRATVRFNLIQAVSALTGLGSDHISVVKMQSD